MSNASFGENCCYASSISKFLEETEEEWIEKMKETFKKNLDLVLGNSQVEAWRDCFRVLVNELKEIAASYPGFDIVFEYILPYESGRRPDVLLLSKEHVIILEFKRKDEVLTSDLDQVSAYARDIGEYHFESRDRTITPVLMLTRTTTLSEEKRDDVYLSCKGRLCRTIKDVIGSDPINQCDLDVWLHSRYEPLPTIVEAARMMMKKEKLPSIRRYSSTCIPDAIGYLIEKIEDAINKKKHVVAFVTGVPGARKTFLGLQFVYDIYDTSSKCNSVYLSGNKPLIKVLKRILGNVFVKDLHKVTEEYLRSGATDFNNNIVVFDEGQRAWDKEQMAKRKKKQQCQNPI